MKSSQPFRNLRSEHLWPAFVLLFIIGVAVVLTPLGSSRLAFLGVPLPTFCTFRIMTGLPCPFCGMTRSWVNFFHGNWHDAQASHPLGPFLLSLFLLYCLYRLIYGKDPKYFGPLALGVVSLFAVSWAFRVIFPILYPSFFKHVH